MKIIRPRVIVSGILGCLSAAAVSVPALAQVTERVSVDSAGSQANGESFTGRITDNGRYLVFSSLADNLVPGDANGVRDAFVHDRLTGTTERVSISSGGAEGGALSTASVVSTDGRYVGFGSEATNLVPGDTNGSQDAFVRDRQSGTTERVSVDSAGAQANGVSAAPVMSPDGRFIAFSSLAANLVAGDTNGVLDVFLRDRQSGTTERVSVDSGEAQSNANCYGPAISADGRFVAFYSPAALVAGDTNLDDDVFVRDRQLGTTERVSVASSGTQADDVSSAPSISLDGRYVVFTSLATNLVPGDTNGVSDIFLRDRWSGTTERVSVDSGGGQANAACSFPAASADGRFVAFHSTATNLVSGDTNGIQDVFVRDRHAGTTKRVNIDSGGTQAIGGDSVTGWISADGRQVLFGSLATNLVPGDTNGAGDVFVHTLDGGTSAESTGPGGAPGNADSSGPSLSPDARFLAYESNATNLVAVDTNGFRDVFLRDRGTETNELASVDSAEIQANATSAHPSVSADGRYVAFDSAATNLVPGDTNGTADVFVRDRQSGTTERVSVDSVGAQGNGASLRPSISADGRYVAFDSASTNLVAGDTNGALDVMVRDRQLGTTRRVSVDSSGTQGLGGGSGDPSISSDGRYVAFESTATNLVPQDTNGVSDVFVFDTVSNTITRWSVDSGGGQGNGASTNASISADGAHVGFQSDATNLVVGDTNTSTDVFERGGGTTRRASQASDGTEGLGGGNGNPSISLDGRFVSFASDATNLVAGDTNGSTDVFVNDRQLGTTRRVSIDSSGTQGASSSDDPSISADGRFIAFDSFASNLVTGDTNGFEDVFLRDEGTASAFEAFCFGDGSGAACPCNNSGATGHGCENSSTTGGAILTATGEASLTDDTVQFTSSSERPTAFSIFLQGNSAIAPIVYGDGLRCTGGQLKRLYTKNAVGGAVVAPLSGDPTVTARSAALGAPIPLGATRHYQVYYRDPTVGFCASPQGSTYNISSGIVVAWGG